MKQKPRSQPLKRKRLGKTDYRARLKLLAGKKPRLVVRKSLKNIIVQIVEFHSNGDKIVVSASTKELQKIYGWDIARRNTPAAYLTGYLAGIKAKGKNMKEAIADLGFQTIGKGSLVLAAVKGAVDAGLKIPHNPESFPNEERIQGKHIKFKKTSFDQVKQAIGKKVKEIHGN